MGGFKTGPGRWVAGALLCALLGSAGVAQDAFGLTTDLGIIYLNAATASAAPVGTLTVAHPGWVPVPGGFFNVGLVHAALNGNGSEINFLVWGQTGHCFTGRTTINGQPLGPAFRVSTAAIGEVVREVRWREDLQLLVIGAGLDLNQTVLRFSWLDPATGSFGTIADVPNPTSDPAYEMTVATSAPEAFVLTKAFGTSFTVHRVDLTAALSGQPAVQQIAQYTGGADAISMGELDIPGLGAVPLLLYAPTGTEFVGGGWQVMGLVPTGSSYTPVLTAPIAVGGVAAAVVSGVLAPTGATYFLPGGPGLVAYDVPTGTVTPINGPGGQVTIIRLFAN